MKQEIYDYDGGNPYAFLYDYILEFFIPLQEAVYPLNEIFPGYDDEQTRRMTRLNDQLSPDILKQIDNLIRHADAVTNELDKASKKWRGE